MSDKTQKYWENLMNSIVDRSSNVLTFSLDVIPPHLMNKNLHKSYSMEQNTYINAC